MSLTYAARILTRDLLNGTSNSDLSHFGWGASGIPFDDAQTALGSELFPSGAGTERNAIYSDRVDNDTIKYIATGRLEADQLDGGSLFEVGLFTAISGGTMFTRKTRYPLVKTTGLVLINEYFLTVTQE